MADSLYNKYRPQSLDEIVGQDIAVKILREKIETKTIPHAILFSGPTGTGKTTLARILRKELNCSDDDFHELNCADLRGIDNIRDIRDRMPYVPILGKTRVWLIDECHSLTVDAQTAMLKMLEDTPRHVYFFLATTNPQKLLSTIKNRCTHIQTVPVQSCKLEELVASVIKKEGVRIPAKVIAKIAECSEGCPRKALVFLESIMRLNSELEMINAIKPEDTITQAIDICRALIKGVSWNDMTGILSKVEKSNNEGIRRAVLGYCSSILCKGKNDRAAAILDVFCDPFFGYEEAGLVIACWRVLGQK